MLPFSIMSSIFGKGNDDGLVMSHQSAWARLCEDYLERHNVSDLIKRALVRLCIAQPDDPVAFLSHYFQLLEKGEVVFLDNGNAFANLADPTHCFTLVE
ncbi:cAMP-dependent protein kinase type I-alpha regulatory subunit [Trichinella pseudospiralis]|uniref:cAMP-dependent protein kinase type I-alpha regulatory subunit n=1 Tax=Trichinella pseudospiralis TaxID=6337 RepID=A0A0V0XXG3_TRIPS|nr:cAMP-dependent protein kinase type I-alpha regulatory subunit [Trichinella pseudospiralis]